MIYGSENRAAFVILTGAVVFYSLVYCFARQVGRRQQKDLQRGKGTAMRPHLIYKRCENPYCTHYFLKFKTVAEECLYCGNALIEPCLDDIVDMEDTREAELQIKSGDMNMVRRYHDLLQQFPLGALRHEEAIVLVMIERRNRGEFSWHPTGEYTLPISKDNVILCEQRKRWQDEMNR